MLAMNGDPLASHDTGAHPQPKAENMAQCRVQIQAAMGRITVQVQRDPHERKLHHQECDERITPKVEINQAVQKIEIHGSALHWSVKQTD
jgi:hypothetical protein